MVFSVPGASGIDPESSQDPFKPPKTLFDPSTPDSRSPTGLQQPGSTFGGSDRAQQSNSTSSGSLDRAAPAHLPPYPLTPSPGPASTERPLPLRPPAMPHAGADGRTSGDRVAHDALAAWNKVVEASADYVAA